MTTTMIGLDDIAAISTAEEGRAVALALYNKLSRWIEITDDPATWPPVGSIVWAVNEYREVAVLMFDGFEHGRMLWRKATKMKLGHYPDEDKIVFKYSITADHGPITHWRPI